jgi:hypothetical protein
MGDCQPDHLDALLAAIDTFLDEEA